MRKPWWTFMLLKGCGSKCIGSFLKTKYNETFNSYLWSSEGLIHQMPHNSFSWWVLSYYNALPLDTDFADPVWKRTTVELFGYMVRRLTLEKPSGNSLTRIDIIGANRHSLYQYTHSYPENELVACLWFTGLFSYTKVPMKSHVKMHNIWHWCP